MRKPHNEFLNSVKAILKQIPGMQNANRIRREILRVRELSNLIKENRTVVVHPYTRTGNGEMLIRENVRDLLKEWIDLYGIVRLRKATAATIDSPAGAVLVFMPQALLSIPSAHDEYLQLVGHQTRKAIRLAEKQGYEIREFVWNDHLDEIYAINTSKELRQSEPMRGWYSKPVEPRYHSPEELLYRKYYGAFKDGKLWAYSHLWISGDFGFPIHTIGHAQHLKYGVVNGLLSYVVRECTGNPQIRWLYYGGYQGRSSLDTFKKHAGFRKYAMLFDLDGDQELLEYSAHKVRTIWRV